MPEFTESRAVRAFVRLAVQLSSMPDPGGLQRHLAWLTSTNPPPGGSTHYDDYVNIACVLSGCKYFFLLAPGYHAGMTTTAGVPPNEQPSVSPTNTTSLAWQVAVLNPDDVLMIPKGWWHWVASDGDTVMVNEWHL